VTGWVRAGEPHVLHALPTSPTLGALATAACGARSLLWRRVDDIDAATTTDCPHRVPEDTTRR
jgi:hypothetical protein